jgi:hypothetical protein
VASFNEYYDAPPGIAGSFGKKLVHVKKLFEKKTVHFSGQEFEIVVPAGDLAEYVFKHAKPSRA